MRYVIRLLVVEAKKKIIIEEIHILQWKWKREKKKTEFILSQSKYTERLHIIGIRQIAYNTVHQ